MEEPSTMFAYELFSRRYGNAIMGFHTYENIQLPNSHNKIVEKSNFVIAGNTEAYNLMSKMRQPDGILPIAGINTELFKPEKSIKDIDVIYFGRYVPEKGVEYIKNIPGKSKEFIVLPQKKYEYMPNFINRAKVSVQYPYSTPNWKEQFNSAIAESLSCNVPVVASNENAIKEYYGTCGDCFIIPPKQQEALNMMVTLVGDSTYPCYGRKYVLKNLDNTVIAKKLIKIFEEVI
jgi:glycosyltransferase involved in cell wall biosynthesis